MKRWAILAVLLIMVSCGKEDASTPDGRGPARLLPDSPPRWSETGDTRVFAGVALSDYINGGSEAYYAYGFREVAVREFENERGVRLTVEIYEMDRPENAYGIFSTDSAGERWPVGADASYGDGLLRFWKGPFFVRIMCYPPDPSIEAAIRETGMRVADSIRAESKRPELFLSLLPEAGVVPDSVCYFHRQTSLNNIRFLSDENLLGLGDEVDAITWEEIVGEPEGARGNLRQIAIRYGSDSAARAAHDSFSENFAGAQGAYSAADIRSSWVVIILDSLSSEAASGALERTLARLAALQKPEG